MAGRVIRGYWDCAQCGTKGIDGLIDVCPNCGSGKGKDVRYYMKSVEEVSEDELAAAGIGKDESDGQHREWVCAYCGFLNNYADQICTHCGAPKEEKEQDYGGDTSEIRYEKDKHGNLSRKEVKEPEPEERYETKPVPPEPVSRPKASPFRWVILAAAAILLAVLFWPHTQAEAITGFSWNRNVTVEELQTFSESGWSMPEGARQTDARRELYGYSQVVDHYETVYETRTRRVLDHYDTSYTYTDNGNGTFTENKVETPVYRTETYEEPVQQAVYRNVPVYQVKYYYDIDRWVVIGDYPTSGEDHEPYWSEEYTLGKNQRDTRRTESYFTTYSETDVERVSYNKWVDQHIGDGIYVTRNKLGMVYSRKERIMS